MLRNDLDDDLNYLSQIYQCSLIFGKPWRAISLLPLLAIANMLCIICGPLRPFFFSDANWYGATKSGSMPLSTFQVSLLTYALNFAIDIIRPTFTGRVLFLYLKLLP